MDVFLNQNQDSFVVELMANYVQATKQRYVKLINLSKTTENYAEQNSNELKFPQFPFMVSAQGQLLNSCLTISLYLCDITHTAQFLCGSNLEEQTQIVSVFELCQRKNSSELIKHFDQQLLSKVFLVKNNITVADIILFCFVHQTMVLADDDLKHQYINLFRWFNHLQHLDGIKQFIQNSNRGFCSFPQPKVVVKELTDKEKKNLAKEAAKEKAKAVVQNKKSEPAKKGASTEPQVSSEDWDLCDLRVGRIVEAWKHPESDKLYCEKIDLGEGSLRQIASGLQPFVDIKDMSGLCVVFANLKPKKLAGFESNGMVMCANAADHSKCEIMRPPEGSVVGERIFVQGKPEKQDRLPVLNPKKQQTNTDNFIKGLRTDSQKSATYQGKHLMTSKGQIYSQTLTDSQIS